MTLSYSLATSSDATVRWMFFLHGIFGTGSNWRTFARRFIAERPDWGAVLVDLRMHGASQGFTPPHTVAQTTADLDAVALMLPGPVRGVVGHSFGGKVALEYVAHHGDSLEQAWILDSSPGPRPDRRGSELIVRVLDTLHQIGPTHSSREAFVKQLEQHGIETSVAQWLAMNLRRDSHNEGHFVLQLNLPAISALLEDYFAKDLWPVLQDPPGKVTIHTVIGGRSEVLSQAERARMVHLADVSKGRLRVYTLANAGHWVHVDDPNGLLAVMLAGTPVISLLCT